MNLISVRLDYLNGSDLHTDSGALPTIKHGLKQEVAISEIEWCVGSASATTAIRAVSQGHLN